MFEEYEDDGGWLVMGKTYSETRTSILMRVGPTKRILEWYETKTLQFGCAANWIDYALKDKTNPTGDIFECIFAHTAMDDPRIYKMTDIKGKPMGDNLLITVNETDATCLLRFEPTILMPVFCMYSFDVPTILAAGDDGSKTRCLKFNLDKYRIAMRYPEEETSFLFITDPISFVEDLRYAIPDAVKHNHENLTSERFYGHFNPSESFLCKGINYHRHHKNELFFDQPETSEDLFWKLPEYEWQSEMRIAIPNINFKQAFDPQNQPYDYKKNTLTVHLPNFHKYARVFSANDAHSLLFNNFISNGVGFDFRVLRLTVEKIHHSSLTAQNGVNCGICL